MAVTINQSELDMELRLLQSRISRVSDILGKDKNEMIKQVAIFSTRSAAIRTAPGEKSNPSKLAKKYKFRPLVKIPESFGYFYTADGENIFRVDKPISMRKKRNKERGIKRVTKGIKIWNKKQRRFTYLPYIGTKVDTTDRRFKIPYAGAGKAGWVKTLLQIDQKAKESIDTDLKKGLKRYGTLIQRDGIIVITNNVSYVSKTSPRSAVEGLRKGSNKFNGMYKKRIERRIDKNWRKAKSSFVKGIRL